MDKFFNRAIIRESFRLVCILVLLMTLLIYAVDTAKIIKSDRIFESNLTWNREMNNEIPREELKLRIIRDVNTRLDYGSYFPIYKVIYPLIVSFLLFSLDKYTGIYDKLRTMPLSKKQIYLSKILVGVLAMLFPILINALILIGANLSRSSLADYYSIGQCLTWLSENSYSFLWNFMLLSLITIVIDGVLPSFILGLIMINYKYIIYYSIEGNVDILRPDSDFRYGPLREGLNFIISIFTGENMHFVYRILLLVFMIFLGYSFYKKARTEEAGILKHPGLKPLYRWGLIISLMLFLGFMLGSKFISRYEDPLARKVLILIASYILGGVLGEKIYRLTSGEAF